MTKVIIQTYPTVGNLEEMAKYRPIGRNTEMFQRLLEEMRALAVAADDLGYWGISHTEHHFHSEGVELSPDPGLYNLWAGTATKRLHHGQLGYVLPTHDPVRLAERTAMIDQMLQGRFFVGLARGYQSRWCDVLGQRIGVSGSDHGDKERDNLNWSLFREHYRILKMAWTWDLARYPGAYYRIPASREETPPWQPAHGMTDTYGVPGEVDSKGQVKGVSVVPRPYQKPHPPLFQAHSISPRTIGWCAREGVTPIIQFPSLAVCRARGEYYRRQAGEAGRKLQLGDGMGLIRVFHIAEDRGAALAASQKYDDLIWNHWYRYFRYLEFFRLPDEEGEVPKPGELVSERLAGAGMSILGSIDDVKRGVEKTLNEFPAEYLVWHLAWRPMPAEEAIRQLELFATHIMPEFGLEFAGEQAH